MKAKKIDWWELSFLLILGCVLTYKFLITTMYEIEWPGYTAVIRFGTIALYCAAKLLLQRKRYLRWEWIASVCLIFLFAIPSFLTTKYSFLVEVACLIVAAKGVSFDKILNVYMAVVGFLLLFTALSSQLGLVTDLVYQVEGRGDRHSFGIKYPTDFAAYLLYWAMAFSVSAEAACMRWQDRVQTETMERTEAKTESRKTLPAKQFTVILTFCSIMLPVIFSVTVFVWCRAYTSVFCLAMLSVLTAIGMLRLQRQKKRGSSGSRLYQFVAGVSVAVPVILSAASIVLAKLYEAGNPFAERVNGFLSGRLEIAAEAFQRYPLRLFGQSVEENGYGGSVVFWGEYFFLDNSYVRMMLEFGLIVGIVMLFLFFAGSYRAMQNGRVILLMTLWVLCLQLFMEHHAMEISYNIFLLLPFAKHVIDEEETV